jgi:ankyrin repeat protein
VGCFDGYAATGGGSEDSAVVDKRNGRLHGIVEMLLNPEVATYRNSEDGDNLLHNACLKSVPTKLCIEIMQLVLSLHKDAVQEIGHDGRLPVHSAVISCDLEVVEFLLGLYPEAANVVTSDGSNLLQLAVDKCSGDDIGSSAISKVKYLCSRYPAMTHQRNNRGRLPVHMAHYKWTFDIALALYEATGIEQFRMPIAHPTAASFQYNGYLPLHLVVSSHSWGFRAGNRIVTEEIAEMFRWWLRVNPEAAGIVGGVGAAYTKTPYQLAVDQELPDYYLRLLLRAAPTLNPAELHRLNYAERRMAMFPAFKATSGTLKAPLLVRLRGESKDLVQRVVSFL